MSQQAAEHLPSSPAAPTASGAPKKKRNYYRKKRKPPQQAAGAPESSGDESSSAESTPERSPSAVPRKRRPRKRKNPAAKQPTQPQDIPSGTDDDSGPESSPESPVAPGPLAGSPSQTRSQGGKWRDQAAATRGKPQHFRRRQANRGRSNPHNPVEQPDSPNSPGTPNRGGKRFQHNQHKPREQQQHHHHDQESSGREEHFKHNDRNRHHDNRQAPSPSPSGGKKSRKQKLYFDEFLPLEQVQKRLEEKTLFQGQFRVNPYRRNESYVTVEGEPVDLKIEGARDTNRALHLDTVVVEIIPKPKSSDKRNDRKNDKKNDNKNDKKNNNQHSKQEKKASQPSHAKNSRPEPDTSDLDTDTATATDLTDLTDLTTDLDTDLESSGEFSDDENPTAHPEEKSTGRKYARVVYILERNSAKQYIGTLQSFSGKGSQLTLGDRIALFVPCDNKIPLVQVDLAKLSSRSSIFTPDQSIVDQLNGNFFMCEIKFDTWKTTQRIPRGKLLQSIGPCCEVSGQYRALKLAHGITHTDQFPDRILDNEFDLSDKEEWHIPESEFQTRHDLRNELIFTVDPSTAKDLDDALSCEPLPDGNFKVGVHIADVSYFVRLNSPLDKEALFRSTTVYFVTENIPMLPRILCDKLCSLQPRVDRLCFSVQWVLTPEGEIISTEFFRSIIRSAAQLSYQTAQQMIDSPEEFQHDEVLARCAKALGFMNQMAVQMKTARYASGSLSLDTPELSFTLDENNQVLDVQQYVRGPSHFLVEEFMLLANQSVAEKIFSTFPSGSLLRKHEPPDEEKLRELVKDCTRLGIPLKANSSKELHDCLEDVLTHRGQFIMTALMKLAIKPMKLAKYCCTNSNLSAESYRHYSLNFPLYTHFTSPIRRYADLVVHRLLGASLNEAPRLPYPSLSVIEKICEQSNTRKTNADRASRQCDQLYMNLFVHSRPSGVVRTGVVLELSQAHVQIYIPSLDFDEVVRFSRKEQDFTAKWREADCQVVLTWPKSESLPECTLTLQVLTELQVQVVPVTERKFMSAGIKILRPAQDPNSTAAAAAGKEAI